MDQIWWWCCRSSWRQSMRLYRGNSRGGDSDGRDSDTEVVLLTTAAGLTVAIPAYLAYMYFSSKSDSYLNEIDKLCQRVVDCISAEGLENAGGNRANRKRRAA